MTYDSTRCVEWLAYAYSFFSLLLPKRNRTAETWTQIRDISTLKKKKQEEKFYLARFDIGNNSKNLESQVEWQVQRCF